MLKSKTTKSALISSVIALVLCFTMLIGSTFAWFTDSITSANNIIKSGNLDIELYHTDDTDAHEKVGSNTVLFDDVALWEPGAVVYETFEVVNEGSLALKYQLSINVTNATANANGNTLADVLKVGVIKGGATTTDDRAALIDEVKEWTALASFTEVGNLVNKNDKDVYTVVIYWEPSENDNDYNMNNGKGEPLTIDIGVTLFATQYSAESDSFNEKYDEYAGLPWDGSAGDVPAEVENVITITNAAELAGFAAAVNSGNTYSGKTVKLAADLDLAGKTWTPIGQNGDKAGFQGTFDGQGHTISNLYVNQTSRAYQSAGLFGSARYATIKNFKIVNATINNLDVTTDSSNGAAVVVGAAQFATTIDNVDVENATVVGNRRVAAIAGYYVGTITNCDVKNVSLTANFDALNDGSYDNADKVGMIIAYSNGASTISNNTVTGGSIIGYRDIGGIAGYATTSTLTNNEVSDLRIVVNNAQNYKSYADLDAHDAGEIIGEGTADATNVATNVTIEMPVASTADLIAAIKEGKTEIELAPGNYVMPTSFNGSGVSLNNKTLTIKGTKDVVIETSHVDERDQYVTGANLAFEGVTLNFGTTNYMGFANAASLTYTDCIINGLQFCYGSGQYSFVNCELNSNGAEHCVWTWGCQNVSFIECDFTYSDRAVNCYGEGVTTNASFTGCTFTKVAGKDTTGAIETNSSALTALNLTINNCSVNEGELVFISAYDSKVGANSTITVDGKEVYVITIGNPWADNSSDAALLKEALSSEAKNIKVILLEDISVDIGTGWNMGGVNTESITIDGNGKTLTLSNTYRSYFNMANAEGKLYLEDMVLTNAHAGTHFFDYTTHFNCDVVATNVKFAKSPLINGTTAVFNNCEFDQTGTDIYGLWIMSGSNVTVNGGTLNTDRGFKITDEDSAEKHTYLTVSGTEFNNTKKAAVLVTTDYGATVNIDNVDISNCTADSTNAVWIDDGRTATADKINVTGATCIIEP